MVPHIFGFSVSFGDDFTIPKLTKPLFILAKTLPEKNVVEKEGRNAKKYSPPTWAAVTFTIKDAYTDFTEPVSIIAAIFLYASWPVVVNVAAFPILDRGYPVYIKPGDVTSNLFVAPPLNETHPCSPNESPSG